MSLVTPINFDYTQLPASIPARKKTRRFSPENSSSFSPSTTSIIRIPIRDSAYLDGKNSYLKFTINNLETATTATPPGSGASLKLDPNANAVIARVRVLVGGVVAEDIQRSNCLVNMLTQAQGSEDYNKALQILAHQAVTDQDHTSELSGKAIPHGGSATVCIPVFSGLLNCDKYLPLNLFQSNALTLELYLETTNSVGVWSADPVEGYSINSVEYIASLIEIQDDRVNDALKNQMFTSGLEFHGQTYTTHINSVGTNTTNATLNIPERCKSLKALITVVRPTAHITGRQYASLQVRYPHTTAGTNFNWYYRVGSENMPSQGPVESSSMTFIEFQKAYNQLFSLDQSCYANTLRWNTAYAAGTDAGCFSMTVSTEAFAHTNMMESGLDTATAAVPISLIIQNAFMDTSAELITYAYKDIIWKIDSTGLFQVSL